MVYSNDRSKAVVPVFVAFCCSFNVALVKLALVSSNFKFGGWRLRLIKVGSFRAFLITSSFIRIGMLFFIMPEPLDFLGYMWKHML